jgi:hypothetical protein
MNALLEPTDMAATTDRGTRALLPGGTNAHPDTGGLRAELMRVRLGWVTARFDGRMAGYGRAGALTLAQL